jgi:hypothetical protein
MNTYDEVMSIGSNCAPGLSLRQFKIKKETYPFDWVRTNSKIIYDVLLTGPEKYTSFNSVISDNYFLKDLHSYTHPNFNKTHINHYGQHFTHYLDISMVDLINKFTRYLDRFFELLNSNKKILFIHSNEEFIYHKKSRDKKEEFYEYLCKINDILIEKYPKIEFKIINIDIDNKFKDYKNISNLNLNLKYDFKLSDFCENHEKKYVKFYRNEVTKIIKSIIQIG